MWTGLDVTILVAHTGGNWSQRYTAKSIGDGVNEVTINLPHAGVHNVFFSVPSLKINSAQLPNVFLQASDP
ncbi:MAG TPA: hypothetical protein VFF59_00510 [Anaerolineae bacterium]|nr:hypothetical protein [Anaerolineae bacterium]